MIKNDPLKKGMVTQPEFWPGEFHDSPRSHTESDMTE